MDGFEKIHFKGKFRTYQQRILDNADTYLKDGKINIVAAPGSGKTVLGLALIRHLRAPCIVFSPTTAIRQQWGERFRELFLDDEEDFPALFSTDLHHVKLLTSVTYQALYASMEKDSPADEVEDDFADVDIFSAMREAGVRTVCLDEAHHLKNEWQQALEKFISSLDKEVKIISLTATPPYDSDGSEWRRYVNVCGEIDEEIFVPELVAQKTLCPHQDYVYFNYPSEAETKTFYAYKKRAADALSDIGQLPFLSEVCRSLNAEKDYETLFSDVKGYVALATLFRYYGFDIDKKLVRELTAGKGLPPFRPQYAETAVQFLLDGERITEEQKEKIVSVLKSHGVYEKKRVTLDLNERLKRTLISSVGKLESIKRIAQSEIDSMGERLRMLILTDYIKKESLAGISAREEYNSVHIVSIFETLRRAFPATCVGVLSGTLVILPNTVDLSGIKQKNRPIPGTDYCTVDFSGVTQQSVDFVGKLFEKGEIRILVGTKSLLGEGWDSPCINSLILASFVGSFVLSNQMRGRAIRTDKKHPDKTANIWHLVTVEPDYLFRERVTQKIKAFVEDDHKELISCDYEILKRRFESFLGPNYTTGTIESGIERLTCIKPPYDRVGIERINATMLDLSRRRDDVKDKWRSEAEACGFGVNVKNEIPPEARVPVFTFYNCALYTLLTVAEVVIVQSLIRATAFGQNTVAALGFLAVASVLSYFLYNGIKKMILHANPANSVKTLGTAVYKTLRECGLISSSAKVRTEAHKDLLFVSLYLRDASVHDQNVFNEAMREMLSPIANPRYVLIAKKANRRYNYELSFSCPSVIGRKKEYVEILAGKLRATTGNFEPVYVYREGGRDFLLKCRRHSYLTFNEKQARKKYKVSHWE